MSVIYDAVTWGSQVAGGVCRQSLERGALCNSALYQTLNGWGFCTVRVGSVLGYYFLDRVLLAPKMSSVAGALVQGAGVLMMSATAEYVGKSLGQEMQGSSVLSGATVLGTFYMSHKLAAFCYDVGKHIAGNTESCTERLLAKAATLRGQAMGYITEGNRAQ